MIQMLSNKSKYRGAKKLGVPRQSLLNDSGEKQLLPNFPPQNAVKVSKAAKSVHDPISYSEALEYLTQDAYINHYIGQLETKQEKKPDMFSQIFTCLNNKAALKNADLLHQ